MGPKKLADIIEEEEESEDDIQNAEEINDENVQLNEQKEDELQLPTKRRKKFKKVETKKLSRKECMESLKNDLIAEEVDDEWVEIKDLDAKLYPATLWCLHVKSFHAAPECSLKKLQQAMACPPPFS